MRCMVPNTVGPGRADLFPIQIGAHAFEQAGDFVRRDESGVDAAVVVVDFDVGAEALHLWFIVDFVVHLKRLVARCLFPYEKSTGFGWRKNPDSPLFSL